MYTYLGFSYQSSYIHEFVNVWCAYASFEISKGRVKIDRENGQNKRKAKVYFLWQMTTAPVANIICSFIRWVNEQAAFENIDKESVCLVQKLDGCVKACAWHAMPLFIFPSFSSRDVAFSVVVQQRRSMWNRFSHGKAAERCRLYGIDKRLKWARLTVWQWSNMRINKRWNSQNHLSSLRAG